MSHEDYSTPQRGDDYKFNQTLVIWPFIVGMSALAFFTTSNIFSATAAEDACPDRITESFDVSICTCS